MANKLSTDTIAKIRQARLSGMTLLDIALDFDIDVSTVSKKCKGIPKPSNIQFGARRTFDYGKAARLKAMGMPGRVLAKRFNVTEQGFYKALRIHAATHAEAAQ